MLANYIVNLDLITKASADASRNGTETAESDCLGNAMNVVIKVIAINHAANNTFSYLHKPSLTEEGILCGLKDFVQVQAKARCETAYGRYQLRWPLITF